MLFRRIVRNAVGIAGDFVRFQMTGCMRSTGSVHSIRFSHHRELRCPFAVAGFDLRKRQIFTAHRTGIRRQFVDIQSIQDDPISHLTHWSKNSANVLFQLDEPLLVVALNAANESGLNKHKRIGRCGNSGIGPGNDARRGARCVFRIRMRGFDDSGTTGTRGVKDTGDHVDCQIRKLRMVS